MLPMSSAMLDLQRSIFEISLVRFFTMEPAISALPWESLELLGFWVQAVDKAAHVPGHRLLLQDLTVLSLCRGRGGTTPLIARPRTLWESELLGSVPHL